MLSIIIINFKNPSLLRLCLKSIIASLSAGFLHEIVVIDSKSSVETRNIVLEFEQAKLVSFKTNIGYTRGVNEGIKNSSGDYFLILNPDIVPLKNSIEKLLDYIKTNKNIGLIGPRLLNFDGTSQSSCFRFYTPWIILCRRTFFGYLPQAKRTLDSFAMKDKDLNRLTYADWLMGSALMTSREAVQKIGLMDQNLFLYMTDVDWARRFWENGYKVLYYPESEMYHYHKRSSKGKFILSDILLKKEARWHIRDAIKYFKKHSVRNLKNKNALS